MVFTSRNGALLAAAGLVVLLLSTAPTVHANWAPGEVMMVRVTASNNAGTGTFEQLFDAQLVIDGRYDWSLAAQETIEDGQTDIATLTSLTVTIETDPQVALGFAVVALEGLDTAFTITTTAVPFAALSNPDAYATASITVTDRNDNGASATGLHTGTKSYEARYNGLPWADLVDPVNAGPKDSETGLERRPAFPPDIFETISDSVSSIEAEYKFTLSAGDAASGTSKFEVIPEPATLLLLGLGAVLLKGKRKS